MFSETEKRTLTTYNPMFDKPSVFSSKKKGDLHDENTHRNVFITRCSKKYKKAPWSNYNGIKTLFPFANASHLLQIEFQSP